jgi:hypothetical protein
MSGKVLDDMEGRFKASNIKPLDGSFLKDTIRIEILERCVGLMQCLIQLPKENSFRRRRSSSKLSRTVPYIFLFANTRHNPLVDIAAQVKNQIANAVVRFVSPPPEVLLAQ